MHFTIYFKYYSLYSIFATNSIVVEVFLKMKKKDRTNCTLQFYNLQTVAAAAVAVTNNNNKQTNWKEKKYILKCNIIEEHSREIVVLYEFRNCL